MLLGSEAIGVVAYAEAVGANQYADVTTGPLQLLIVQKTYRVLYLKAL